MSPEEMLLDPWNVAASERVEPGDPRRHRADRELRGPEAVRAPRAARDRDHDRAHDKDAPRGPEVPPVRTIVLDRPPVAVAPPLRERNPLRARYPSSCGSQVRSGRRQSMPSSSIDNCARVNETVPLAACGHTKRPRSKRLE